MKMKLLAWVSWITFLASAVAEWGLHLDLPLTPVLWLIVATSTLIATTTRAAVTTNSWILAGSGKWEDGGHWSLLSAPAPSNGADIITNASTKIVTIDAFTTNLLNTMTISNLTIFGPGTDVNTLQLTNAGTATPLNVLTMLNIGGGGAVLVSGSQLVNTNFGAQLIVGDNGTGQLTASNATVQAFQMYAGVGTVGSQGTITFVAATNSFSALSIGATAGSTGFVWATQSSLVSTGSGDIVSVGNFGFGQMTLSNGSMHATDVSVGRFVGSSGGVMSFVGGTNQVDGALQLAVGAGTTATVSMVNSRLIANNGSITIGVTGAGQMTLSNTTMLGDLLYVGGGAAGSEGTFTMSGSSTNLQSSFVSIAPATATRGTAWMSGGLWVVTNDVFTLGNFGNGTMTLSNGTLLASAMFVARFPGSSGSLTARGGTMIVSSNLTLGICADAIGDVTLLGGSIFVTNTAHSAVLDVRDGAFWIFSGTVKVDTLIITNACGQLLRYGGTLSAMTTNLDPNLSAAGDGIPNSWKQQHGLDPFDPNVANEDPDGDGFTNLQEYQNGTDPQDPNSNPLRITSIAKQGNDMLLTWITAAGKTNVVQFTKGTAGGSYSNNFADLSPVIIPTGSATNYLDVGGATNTPSRFYRVRLVP